MGATALQAVESQYHIQYRLNGLDQPKGAGAFGQVRPCTHRETLQLRAIKTIEKKDWNHRTKILEEVRLLRLVRGANKHIVEFMETFEEWHVIHLIFEYCPRGSVEDRFADGTFSQRGGYAVASTTHHLFDALDYLNSVNIIHRDVKPANLLFAEDETMRLADFGCARELQEGELVRNIEGSPAFFAPEICMLPKGKGCSFPADMWAAGVTLYMMLHSGTHPFDNNGSLSSMRLKAGDYSLGWFTNSAAAGLLRWCLMPYPPDRLRAGQALRHPWLSSFGLGPGDLQGEAPRRKIPDSHGNWVWHVGK